MARDAFDLDGDGYAAVLGGGDDRDANINPGAVDIPGNGIDEDCDWVDASAPARASGRLSEGSPSAT
jgi:hypothetical protein